MSIFGEEAVTEGGWEEKRKYCQFKAGTILKALKAGQQPPRGNPNDPNNTGEREMPKPPEPVEEKKESEIVAPPLPDMNDLQEQLARLENGGSAQNNVVNPNPPPLPDFDFGIHDPMGGNNLNPGIAQPKSAPVYNPGVPQ